MAKKLTATQKLRRNVLQQVRRLEKRGYGIDADLKEKLKSANYSRLKSYQRSGYKRLYSETTAEEEGKIVSGTEKRHAEASRSAIKSAQTRKAKANLEKAKERSQDDTAKWEQQRRLQDAIDRRNAEMFEEGSIAYENVLQTINEYPTKGSLILKQELDRQVAKYGRDNVVASMSHAPDTFIQSAQEIVFYEKSSEEIHRAVHDFAMLLLGYIPSAEESKEIGNMLDDMTDFEDE